MNRDQDAEPPEIRGGDRWSGAALALLATYVAFEAFQLPFGTVSQPGPGFFPVLLAVVLFVLAAAIMITARAPGPVIRFAREARDVAALAGALLVVAVFMDRLGFIVCATAAMLLLLRAVARLSWPASAALAAGGALVVFALFTTLGVPLPKGLLLPL